MKETFNNVGLAFIWGIKFYIALTIILFLPLAVLVALFAIPFSYILYFVSAYTLGISLFVAVKLYFYNQQLNNEKKLRELAELEKNKVRYVIIQ